MSIDSGMRINRRVPRQERAERRVRELLEAAASEIAEVGYESATMKAIAQRAGASIGAVYQYFPNKEAVVSALRILYVKDMEQRWIELEQATARSSVKERTHRFMDVMIRFMEEHPAYNAVMDAPVSSKRDQKTRNRLRERLANDFRTRGRALSQEQAYTAARLTGLAILGSLQRELGSLDRILAWIHIFGMVNSAPGFRSQPAVINGFTDLIINIFGSEIGAHARSAVGLAELPFNIPVEIEGEVELRPE